MQSLTSNMDTVASHDEIVDAEAVDLDDERKIGCRYEAQSYW